MASQNNCTQSVVRISMFASEAEISAAHLIEKRQHLLSTRPSYQTVFSHSCSIHVNVRLRQGNGHIYSNAYMYIEDISIFPEFIVCFARMRAVQWKEYIKKRRQRRQH